MNNTQKNNRSTKIWFWLALILSWLTFITFLTSPFGLLFWIITLIILFFRKSNLKWYLILFSAWTVIPTYSFLSGTKDYFKGQAIFKGIGYPEPECYNLNKQFRVWNSSSGCFVIGFEPLIYTPNNWAIELWTNLLGFQKGVYHGTYPDKIEASKLLDSLGQEISFSKNGTTYEFYIDNNNYTISGYRHINMPNLARCKSAKVAIIDKELIIFKPITKRNILVMYLADSKTGKIFARYYEGTERYPREYMEEYPEECPEEDPKENLEEDTNY